MLRFSQPKNNVEIILEVEVKKKDFTVEAVSSLNADFQNYFDPDFIAEIHLDTHFSFL